jgi:enterochelin esterase-like enzyme
VGAFSSAIRWIDPDGTSAGVLADAAAANRKLALLWIGCGRGDGLFAENDRFRRVLEARGVGHVWRPTAGQHSWTLWRHYLRELAGRLFRH